MIPKKLVQIWWTGLKYAYDPKTDITFAWYGQAQNVPSSVSLSIVAGFRSSCAGDLEEGSLYLDHHLTRAFRRFCRELAYSFVTGGLVSAVPHGPGVPYLHNTHFAPTLGGLQLLIVQVFN